MASTLKMIAFALLIITVGADATLARDAGERTGVAAPAQLAAFKLISKAEAASLPGHPAKCETGRSGRNARHVEGTCSRLLRE